MKQKFTFETLIKYIYRETSVGEMLSMNDELRKDPVLMAEYLELKESYRQLPKVTFDPKPSVLQNILRYSAHSAVEA